MDIERLIEAWRGPLTGLLAGWGADWGAAAELAQDTLVEAYLARSRFEGDPGDPAATGPWLRGIARNLFLAHGRARKRGGPELFEGSLEASAPAPEGGEHERVVELRAAMARLPEDLRTVVYARYLEEASVREVAGLLGLTEKAVEGRLRRAREQLRERLLPKTRGTSRTSGPRTGRNDS